ncbi:unnamed protein product [[Candida] boidinii]|nr:unnamed protein product [[Candida] boidinii]
MNSSTSLYSYKRSVSSFSANDQIALGESSTTPRHPSQASNSSYFQQQQHFQQIHGQQNGGLPPINTSFGINTPQYSPEINTRTRFPHNGEHEVDPMNYANGIGHGDGDANGEEEDDDDDDHVTISYMDQSNNQQQGINNELSRSKSKSSSRMSIGNGGNGSVGVGVGLGFRSASATNYNNSAYDDEGIITGHSSTVGTGNGGTNIQMITKLSAHKKQKLQMKLLN